MPQTYWIIVGKRAQINTSYFLRAAGASENTRARAKRVQRGLSANGHLGQNGGPKKAGPNQCMLRCFPSGRWSKWGVQKNVTKSILSRAISIRPAGRLGEHFIATPFYP